MQHFSFILERVTMKVHQNNICDTSHGNPCFVMVSNLRSRTSWFIDGGAEKSSPGCICASIEGLRTPTKGKSRSGALFNDYCDNGKS